MGLGSQEHFTSKPMIMGITTRARRGSIQNNMFNLSAFPPPGALANGRLPHAETVKRYSSTYHGENNNRLGMTGIAVTTIAGASEVKAYLTFPIWTGLGRLGPIWANVKPA